VGSFDSELDSVGATETRWFHDRYDLLLGLLLLLLATFAFDSLSRDDLLLRIFEALLVALIVIVGVAASGGMQRRGVGIVTIVVSLLAAGSVIEPALTDNRRASWGLLTALIAAVPFGILRRILRHPRIDARTIFGALCVYFLIGYTFAFALLFVSSVSPIDTATCTPAAITVEECPHTQGIAQSANPKARVLQPVEYVYFSFITLTTVGYGDYVPRGQFSQILAVLAAISGQVLLVTLVARLVSNYGQERGRPGEEPAEAA